MEESYWSRIGNRRLSRRAILVVSGSATAGAALLAACGSSSSTSVKGSPKSSLVSVPSDTTQQAKRGGVFKSYTNADRATLDVLVSTTEVNSAPGLVYDELLQYKSGYLKSQEYEVVPQLIESWEWSPDRLSLVAKLRTDVKWHNKAPVNGRALDMDDVLFSWQRFATKSGNRAALAASASPDAPVQSVTATDSRTIVFKLQYPVVYLLALLATSGASQLQMVPKETDGSFDARRDMIGTGPFMLLNYTPSVGFTFKRNLDYYLKDEPLLDQIDLPIIPEYASAVAQFKTGNLHTYDVKSEDVLTLKQETPDIGLYQGEFQNFIMKTGFGWLPAGKSPFLDQRVRQALSMSYDRDLWIDTFFNVSKFESEGLPVETRWATSLNPAFVGSWLDPKSKNFGPNAKYFQHDVAEAKKLLSAAGYGGGLDVVSFDVAGPQYGNDFARMIQVLEQMAHEVGFRATPHLLDYNTEFIPKYRDSMGKFEGWQYKKGTPSANDPVPQLSKEFESKAGAGFWGFDVNGKGDFSGDPYLDDQFAKARSEIDNDRRRGIIQDVQRYLAEKMYAVNWPGGASGFLMAWPALRNFNVYRGGRDDTHRYHFWLDDSMAPLKKA